MGKKKSINSTAGPVPPPLPKKIAGAAEAHAVEAHEEKRPVWSFILVDHDYVGEWSWHNTAAEVKNLFDFLKEMERMTWKEIRAQTVNEGRNRTRMRHHDYEPKVLCQEAIKRLEFLQLDDVTSMFRFRVKGAERLWGIILPGTNVFCPVWWDLNHKVYPMSDR